MALRPLSTPLDQLGIPPKTLARLQSLGLSRGVDLLLHRPLRYEDESHVQPLSDFLPEQPGCAIVTVQQREVHYQPRRCLQVRVTDGMEDLILRFLHFYPSQLKLFEPGQTLRLFGAVRVGYHGREMIHPRCQAHSPQDPLAGLTAVYPSCAGLSQNTLRRLVQKMLTCLDLRDPLPLSWCQALHFPSLEEVLKTLHTPRDLDAQTENWMARLKFDELLAQQLSFQLHRRRRAQQSAPPLHEPQQLLAQVVARLPFSLTPAQHCALEEIRQDLRRPFPMHRLLQGDVGCGKTIVAALAAVQCLDAGHQVALMAPTELLAQQHQERLNDWLAPLALPCLLLTSQLKTREQRHIQQRIQAGETALIIGTHALIQDRLTFHSLGLVIIDEQHRFGVDQRLNLTQKGGTVINPHLLMMSATPIPRSLSMSYYADLEISTIDEIPPGRQGITTKLVVSQRRPVLIEHIHQACRAGQQVYWVCPLVDESEQLDLRNAVTTFDEWRAIAPDLRCGLLHGKLASTTKTQVMGQFLKGDIQLLVATSVIEVGVDVPQATVMVIEHAERMGLAQLHQMRGRVGRGQHAGVCFLLYDTPLSDLARQRLKVIFEHQDGFEIARMDLHLRGPGDYLGARQSGMPLLRFADPLEDDRWLQEARQRSLTWLAQAPEQAQQFAEDWLAARQPYLAA